jgi:NAD(P) transhydrogenase subunit alpha
LPMLTTAAGGIKPAKMIALGAGVAGLQAIATARRLGAVVHGFDVREAAREQVESLGARFVSPGEALKAQQAANGYAADQSANEQAALRRALAPTLAQMQLIVTSAQIPGRPAPLLIDDETLAGLAPGTVIVDLAAETGGNTSRTKPGETVTAGGVKIVAPRTSRVRWPQTQAGFSAATCGRCSNILSPTRLACSFVSMIQSPPPC